MQRETTSVRDEVEVGRTAIEAFRGIAGTPLIDPADPGGVPSDAHSSRALDEIKELVHELGEYLCRRDEQIVALLSSVPPGTAEDRIRARSSAEATADAIDRDARRQGYREEVARIFEVARAMIPTGSTVLVVSRGDDALLRLERCVGWHFPQLENGVRRPLPGR